MAPLVSLQCFHQAPTSPPARTTTMRHRENGKKIQSLDRGTENCVVFAGCQCVWVSVMRQRTQDTELTEYSCSSSDA